MQLQWIALEDTLVPLLTIHLVSTSLAAVIRVPLVSTSLYLANHRVFSAPLGSMKISLARAYAAVTATPVKVRKTESLPPHRASHAKLARPIWTLLLQLRVIRARLVTTRLSRLRHALPVPLAPPTRIKIQQRNAPRAMQGNTRHLQPHHARHAQLGKLTQTTIHQHLARRAVLASMLQQVALTAPHVTRVQPIWMLPLQLHVLLAAAVSTRLSRLRHAHHVPWEPLMLTQTRQHHVSRARPGRTLHRQLQPASHVRLAKLT